MHPFFLSALSVVSECADFGEATLEVSLDPLRAGAQMGEAKRATRGARRGCSRIVATSGTAIVAFSAIRKRLLASGTAEDRLAFGADREGVHALVGDEEECLFASGNRGGDRVPELFGNGTQFLFPSFETKIDRVPRDAPGWRRGKGHERVGCSRPEKCLEGRSRRTENTSRGVELGELFGKRLRMIGKGESFFVVGGGAGIVHDSVPESEWQETNNKARALLRAADMVQQCLDAEP